MGGELFREELTTPPWFGYPWLQPNLVEDPFALHFEGS